MNNIHKNTHKNAQLVSACWQTWTWLSWPDWTVLLTGLFMHVGTDCSWLDERTVLNNVVGTDCSWLDERTDLNNVVDTIMLKQQPCSCMIEHVVREWWNNKIEQRCYNNHELGCCIKSGFACSNICEQPLSIRQTVTICGSMVWLNNTTILSILFYHVNSVVTGLLSQQHCNSLRYFYACNRVINVWVFEFM